MTRPVVFLALGLIGASASPVTGQIHPRFCDFSLVVAVPEAYLDNVRVLVAVESVEFDECVYRPSQAAQVFDKRP
jgi:hypothetical protein